MRKHIAKTGYVYLLVSLFCALSGAIYEYFSHDVYSGYMVYAFMFPLAGGALPFLSMAQLCRKLPGMFAMKIYHSGIATLTLGSIITGVLEIYGTTNVLVKFYWYIGLLLIATALLLCIINSITGKNSAK